MPVLVMRKGEVASLRWEDLDGDVIRLQAENAKNSNPRSVPIDGELEKLIKRRRAAREMKSSGGVVLAGLAFHRDSDAIADFRRACAKACVCRRPHKPKKLRICRNNLQGSSKRHGLKADINKGTRYRVP